MELHNNRVGDFYKRIESQQSDSAKKIPFRREIQFSKKKRRNETMKNGANQYWFFLENQISRRTDQDLITEIWFFCKSLQL